MLNKNLVDQLKLDAIKTLQEFYLRPDTNQPLWVTYKKYEPWQNKDRFLANNCLPAHLSILPTIKNIAPNATVVVGTLYETDQASFKVISEHIKNFHPIHTQDPDKYFHAWIKLNTHSKCSSILDFTSNIAINSTNGYLDTPLSNGHVEILKTQESVYDFHAKYIKNRFYTSTASGTPDSNTKEFLENFSKQQNINPRQAFGTLIFPPK